MRGYALAATFRRFSVSAAVLVTVAGVLVIGESAREPSSGEALVGTWRLISRVDRTADGRTLDEPTLGSDPIALLVYDHAGNVAAQLMRRNRTTGVTNASNADPNNSAAVNGYDAYFGTYTVDVAAGTVTHTLIASLVAADVGRRLVRHFRFENGDLIIWFEARSASGEAVTRTLTWRRAA